VSKANFSFFNTIHILLFKLKFTIGENAQRASKTITFLPTALYMLFLLHEVLDAPLNCHTLYLRNLNLPFFCAQLNIHFVFSPAFIF
jgi:hypothetical protein